MTTHLTIRRAVAAFANPWGGPCHYGIELPSGTPVEVVDEQGSLQLPGEVQVLVPSLTGMIDGSTMDGRRFLVSKSNLRVL